jgi:hypothetical protein
MDILSSPTLASRSRSSARREHDAACLAHNLVEGEAFSRKPVPTGAAMVLIHRQNPASVRCGPPWRAIQDFGLAVLTVEMSEMVGERLHDENMK